MKTAATVFVAAALVLVSGVASAQSKYQKESDAHYKRQQQTRETQRQTDNRTVNSYSQRNYSNSQRSSSYKR